MSLLFIITNKEIRRKIIVRSLLGRSLNQPVVKRITTRYRNEQFVMRLLLERIEAEPRYH